MNKGAAAIESHQQQPFQLNNLSSPANFQPCIPRSQTPNNFIVGRKNSRSFTRFVPGATSKQNLGGISVGVPYQSKQYSSS